MSSTLLQIRGVDARTRDELAARAARRGQSLTAYAPDGEGFTDEELAGITAPVLEVLGDLDFVPFDHLTVMQQLIPDCRIGVLPGTTHTEVPTRADLLAPMLKAFLTAEG